MSKPTDNSTLLAERLRALIDEWGWQDEGCMGLVIAAAAIGAELARERCAEIIVNGCGSRHLCTGDVCVSEDIR